MDRGKVAFMAHILQVHEQEAIARLAAQGWSKRKIARELKVHRETVRNYYPCGPA